MIFKGIHFYLSRNTNDLRISAKIRATYAMQIFEQLVHLLQIN